MVDLGGVSLPLEQWEVMSLLVGVEVYFHLAVSEAVVAKLSQVLSEAMKAYLSFEIYSQVLVSQVGAFVVACSH